MSRLQKSEWRNHQIIIGSGLLVGLTFSSLGIASASTEASFQTRISASVADEDDGSTALVPVFGDSGKVGYAYAKDLDGDQIRVDASVAEIRSALSERSVPVFLSDGVTQIDTFTTSEPQGWVEYPDGTRIEFDGVEEYLALWGRNSIPSRHHW